MSHRCHSDRRDREERPRSLGEILARKRELIERSAAQRQTLAASADGLSPAFAAADRVVGVGRAILSRPLLLAGAVGFLIALRPRAVLAMATRGFALWNGVRAVRRLLAPHA